MSNTSIIPHPKRPDWYRVPFDQSEPVWGVPGHTFEGGMISVHRSHLPLLDPSQADRFRARNALGGDAWRARDAWCGEHGIKLRNTQHQAIDFAHDRRGVLLFDEQRLGKTLSALMMDVQWRSQHTTRAYGPLVIVAPLSTRAVWLGWARRVFPGVEIGVITGKTFDKSVLAKPIIFGHYDVIHKWQALFDVGTLVLDEVQALTNATSRRSLAAALLASKAKHVVACTGTPINKYPPDLWGILNLVAPGAWGTYYEFCQRYGDPEPTAHGTVYRGISHEAELKARLDEIMIRRRWRDCHADLPPITRSVVVADLTQTERNKLDVLAGKLKGEHTNTAANLAAYRKQVTSIKVPTVLREAARVLARGTPVVIWTWHKDFAEKLHAKLVAQGGDDHPAWMIHGEVAIAEREHRMAAWKAHPAGALIANMAVAGAGIDLSHAPIAIFGELDYVPAMIGQAEMRTYAPTRAMDVIFVIANHFVDQRIVRALIAKLSAADPLGVAAAIEAIDALREGIFGPEEEGSLDRLLEDLLASAA